MIPSMGGLKIGKELRDWASKTESGTAVVELGVWLGSGSEHLALGIQDSGNNVELHCFDNFKTTRSEAMKTVRGIKLIKDQDTLPLVKKYLSKIKVNIIYHKGNVIRAKWKNKPISLYVDDVCKRTKKFNHAIKTFSPFWIPGKTIIVLMDYYWHKKHLKEPDAQCQPEFINKYKKCFRHLKDWKFSSCAAFLYLGGLR